MNQNLAVILRQLCYSKINFIVLVPVKTIISSRRCFTLKEGLLAILLPKRLRDKLNLINLNFHGSNDDGMTVDFAWNSSVVDVINLFWSQSKIKKSKKCFLLNLQK